LDLDDLCAMIFLLRSETTTTKKYVFMVCLDRPASAEVYTRKIVGSVRCV